MGKVKSSKNMTKMTKRMTEKFIKTTNQIHIKIIRNQLY